jgi:hypothetical protein
VRELTVERTMEELRGRWRSREDDGGEESRRVKCGGVDVTNKGRMLKGM